MDFSIFTIFKKRDIVKFIRIHMVGKLKLLLLSLRSIINYNMNSI